MAWYFLRIQHPWLAISVRMFGACAVFGKLGWTKKLWRVDNREEIGRLLTMCTGVQCVSVCMQHSSIQLPQHTQTFPPALSPTPLPTPPIYLFIQPPPLSHPLHLNWFVRCFQTGPGKWACCIMWLVFSSGYRQGIHDTMSYLLCMTVIFLNFFKHWKRKNGDSTRWLVEQCINWSLAVLEKKTRVRSRCVTYENLNVKHGVRARSWLGDISQGCLLLGGTARWKSNFLERGCACARSKWPPRCARLLLVVHVALFVVML